MKQLFLIAVISMTLLACVQAQQQAETWNLETPHTSYNSYYYQSAKYTQLKPGFQYSPTSGNYFKADVDPYVIVPGYSNNITGGSDDNNAGGAVGTLSLQVNVNEYGASQLNIPIQLPPGIASMTPNLSLSYNSQAGDGILGIGWTIGGLSKISRTPYTYYYNAFSQTVDFENTNQLMLDGMYLLKASDGKYYLEVQDFSVIEPINGLNINLGFKVLKTNGLVYEYGTNENSRYYLQSFNTPIEWYLSKITDPFGNYITFNYTNDRAKGSFYPDYIRYTGNSAHNTEPMYEVKFEYSPEERTDTQKKYFATSSSSGHYSLVNKLLEKITITYLPNGNAVLKYLLSYESGGLLPKMQLNAVEPWFYGERNQCSFNPIRINWENSDYTLSRETIQDNLTFSALPTNAIQTQILSANFKNKNVSDLVHVGIDNTTSKVYLHVYENLSLNFEGGLWYKFDSTSLTYTIEDGRQIKTLTTCDTDGDGIDELVCVYKDGNTTKLSLIRVIMDAIPHFTEQIIQSNLSGLWPLNAEDQIIFADYTGNGLTDVAYIKESGANDQLVNFFLSSASNSFSIPVSASINLGATKKIMLGDYDGNRKSQLLVITSDASKVIGLNADNATLSIQTITNDFQNLTTTSGEFTSGDFNGDGKTDVLFLKAVSNDNWLFFFSKGGGSFLPAQTTVNDVLGGSSNKRIITDLNNDGFSDICFVDFMMVDSSNNSVYKRYYRTDYLIRADNSIKINKVKLTNTNGQRMPIDEVKMNLPYSGQFNHCIGNFTGSSPTQIMFGRIIGDVNYPFEKKFKPTLTGPLFTPFQQVVSKITDGFGAITTFNYSPVSYQFNLSGGSKFEETINEMDKSYIYPVSRFRGFMNVVSKIKKETSQGVYKPIKCYYSNPVVHAIGKGLLGFEITTRYDSINALIYQNMYSYNNIYFHQLLTTSSIHTLTSPSRIVFLHEFVREFRNYPNFNYSIYFPYISNEVKLLYEAPSNVAYSSEKTTYSNLDDYGNPISILQQFGTGPGSYVYSISKSIEYDNFISTTRRFTGLLKSETSIFNLGEVSSPITKKINYENSPQTGFRTNRIFEQGSNKEIVETYTPDNFGNIVSTSISTSGYETRTYSTIYTADKRFPASITNPKGQVKTFQYNLSDGRVKSETDENNNTTTYFYDCLGNLIKTVLPDGNQIVEVKRWIKPIGPNPDTPSFGDPIYFIWSRSSGNSEICTFYNQNQKPIREVSFSMSGDAIYKDYKYYDIHPINTGLLHKQSLPYFGASETPKWVTYLYDYKRRLSKTTKPDASFEQTTFSGLTQNISQFDGQLKTIKQTSAGLIDEIIDNNSNTLKHTYYGDGKLKKITQAGLEITAVTYDYDVHRRLISMQDPALGLTIYDYNAFGDLTYKSDARSDAFFQYDKLGRLVARNDNDGNAQWIWDNHINGIGKLGSSSYQPLSGQEPLVEESYNYDEYGRIVDKTQSIDNNQLSFIYTYDIFGRMKTQTWPSGVKLTNYYDENGNLRNIMNDQGEKLWEFIDADHWNKVTKYVLGAKIIVANQYSPLSGLVTTTKANYLAAFQLLIQHMTYEWHANGNMHKRNDLMRNMEEEFGYDGFNRLKTIKMNSGTTNEVGSYATTGNITGKLDAGTYFYTIPSRPYAVGTIVPVPNSFPADAQSITYTSFNKLKNIIEGNNILSLSYGANRERVLQQQSTLGTGTQTTKRYFNSLYEIEEESNGQKKYIHYFTSTSGVFGIFTLDNNTNTQMQYVIKDHQGSIAELVNLTNNSTESYSFDAWGRRRNAHNWTYNNLPTSFGSSRGYTFHEHLDKFKLINMNGRIYDPLVGRFLSPDPFVQLPSYSQSYNRFSYAFNNPLRFTDLSGYISEGDSTVNEGNRLPWLKPLQSQKNYIQLALTYTNTDNVSVGPEFKGTESTILAPLIESKVNKSAEEQSKGNKQKLSLKDKELPKNLIDEMKLIHNDEFIGGNVSELFDEESLNFAKNERWKSVEMVYDNSIVMISLVNPSYAPDYGNYYQVKFRDFQTFGRVTYGTIHITGQKSVVSLHIYNSKTFYKTFYEIFKDQ